MNPNASSGSSGNSGTTTYGNGSTWLVGASQPIHNEDFDAVVGDTLYYVTTTTNNGRELWAYDTSNASSWLAADLSPGSSSTGFGTNMKPIVVGDTIYFEARPSGTSHDTFWAHDTSNGSTWEVADLGNSAALGQYMAILVGDTLYFDADGGSDGRELWAHDTSNHSTWQVTERLHSGSTSASSNPGFGGETLVGDTMYFSKEATNATGYSFTE